MLNISRMGNSNTLSSLGLVTMTIKVKNIQKAPEFLRARLEQLVREKHDFFENQVDQVSPENLDKISTQELLDEEYKIGRVEGDMWANSASYPALRAAALRRTTQEAIEKFHEDCENRYRQEVDILSHFEHREREVYWAFRDKFRRLMEDCASRYYLPSDGEYPNALFRSYEQGWTEAVRRYWKQVYPYVEGYEPGE